MPLYSWGSNKYGELGLLSEKKNCTFPHAVSSIEKQAISSMSCGEGHSIIVTELGDVFTFGRGNQGQLGLGSKIKGNINSPQLVKSMQHEYVVSVAAGSMTSFAVTATGKVYQWGLVLRNNNTPIQEYDEENTIESTSISTSDLQEPEAAFGVLPGLAKSGDIMVQPDLETRNEMQRLVSESESVVSSQLYGHSPMPGSSRMLSEIVSNSTERWLLANDDTQADCDYRRELEALGYKEHEEELTEREKSEGRQRERQYQGMLRVGCHRAPQASYQKLTTNSF